MAFKYDLGPSAQCFTFGGIVLQEYCQERGALVGDIKNIFKGSELGYTEGPHLYRIREYYYLITAEGGTGFNHAMTCARAKKIEGPYEIDPIGQFVTAQDNPAFPIQRAGHGDLVQTPEGDWYAVHLCSRPLPNTDSGEFRSPMGRESAIEKIILNEEGWFRIASGGVIPELKVTAPTVQVEENLDTSVAYEFTSSTLHPDFQWLRTSDPSQIFSLSENPGSLRLHGRESIGSWYLSSLVARRQQDFCFCATTKMAFIPKNFQQMAGLVCYYNSHKFHYLYLSVDEKYGYYLNVMSCTADQSLNVQFPVEAYKNYVATGELFLRATVRFHQLVFSWSYDGKNWNDIDLELDYSLLSDEAGKGEGVNFTGAFVGMCCQDVSGQREHADFSCFSYEALPE